MLNVSQYYQFKRQRKPTNCRKGMFILFNCLYSPSFSMLPSLLNKLKLFLPSDFPLLRSTENYFKASKVALCLIKYHDLKIYPLLNQAPHHEDVLGECRYSSMHS
jgi:hypothetical protein